MAILIVDDDPSIRKVLRRCFEMEGYSVFEASNGTEMFGHIEQQQIELVTLDLSLGKEDGLDLARELRKSSNVGLIMVSGRDDLVDTVVGLEIGADDYITKPFKLREVLARVRTVLRRSPVKSDANPPNDTEYRGGPLAENPELFHFLDWTLNCGTRALSSSKGNICELTTGEYDLLKVLLQNSQRVLTRDQILDQMRGTDWSPTDRIVDNHIARLRRKLTKAIGDDSLIKTVRGTGYMFTCSVTKI